MGCKGQDSLYHVHASDTILCAWVGLIKLTYMRTLFNLCYFEILYQILCIDLVKLIINLDSSK